MVLSHFGDKQNSKPRDLGADWEGVIALKGDGRGAAGLSVVSVSIVGHLLACLLVSLGFVTFLHIQLPL